MIRRATCVLAALLLLASGAAAQDKEDVIQLKGDQKFLFGRITAVNDKGIEFTQRDGSRIAIDFKDMQPGTVYKIKSDRLAADDAKGHFDLGEFCLGQGMFTQAVVEYDKALAIDKSYADQVKKRREDVHNEEARSKFEEMKRLGSQKKYPEALDLLKQLGERFSDTAYFEEAKKEGQKLRDEIEKENLARAKAIDDKTRKKEEAVAKSKEDAEKQVLAGAIEALEEAKALYTEGLDQEMKPNLTKADKAWKNAETKIMAAKAAADKLLKSNDIAMIKQAKEFDKDLDGWLVRTYYRLGRMWAAELSYTEAMVWLNKGLKLAPDDPLLNGIQLTLTQMQMRKRAAGGGY